MHSCRLRSRSVRTVTDKIQAIIFPITAFVAAGFEHSVANMYFVPIALFIKQFDPAFVADLGLDVTNLTWGNFLIANLLPVTIGNIIGGGGDGRRGLLVRVPPRLTPRGATLTFLYAGITVL
jgi:formate/nitrite transporter FocA (FNT family)